MTTVTNITVHTTEADPEQGIDALKRAMALVEELKAIPGIRVLVTGDIGIKVKYDAPAPTPAQEHARKVAEAGGLSVVVTDDPTGDKARALADMGVVG